MQRMGCQAVALEEAAESSERKIGLHQNNSHIDKA